MIYSAICIDNCFVQLLSESVSLATDKSGYRFPHYLERERESKLEISTGSLILQLGGTCRREGSKSLVVKREHCPLIQLNKVHMDSYGLKC